MYCGMYKKIDNNLKSIKKGIRRDFLDRYGDKINYTFNGKEDVSSLKTFVLDYLKELNKEDFEDFEIETAIKLNKVMGKQNSAIANSIALASIFLSFFCLIFNFFVSHYFSSLSLSMNLIEKNSEMISFIGQSMGQNISNAAETIIEGIKGVGIIIVVGIIISWFLHKRKSDSYIYYSFLYDCIRIIKEEKQG